jgi:RNA polymerase sigma factor (TIGR02999 family)
MSPAVSLTEQLQAFSSGDREMAEAILREILPKLHQLAVRHVRKERYLAPVSPTELINEVWLRHIHKGGWHIRNREHFYAIAGCAMRRVLVDFARDRLALKRGAFDPPVFLDEAATAEQPDPASASQVVEIGLLMEQMGKARPEAVQVVDMHYFAGFSFEEISEITGLSLRQVRHRWEKGRDWLKDHLMPRKDRVQSVPRTTSRSGDGATDSNSSPEPSRSTDCSESGIGKPRASSRTRSGKSMAAFGRSVVNRCPVNISIRIFARLYMSLAGVAKPTACSGAM